MKRCVCVCVRAEKQRKQVDKNSMLKKCAAKGYFKKNIANKVSLDVYICFCQTNFYYNPVYENILE